MNEGVKILIERMESNPEDFLWEGKFHVQAVQMGRAFSPEGSAKEASDLWYLDTDDFEQLRVAYCKYLQNQFTATVVETLFTEPKQEEKTSKAIGGATFLAGWTDPRLMNAVKQNMALQNIELQNQALQNSILQSNPLIYQSRAEQQKSGGFMDAVARTMGLK
jgi:hypothetical protein